MATTAHRTLDELFRERWVPSVRLAVGLTSDRGAAEEIVQDAFLAVARRWATVDNPAGYLRTSVVNRCRDHHRRIGVRRRVPPPPTASTAPTTSSTVSTSVPASDGSGGSGGTDGDGPGSGEVRPAERRGLLDPATSDVPLGRLADVVELHSANWPVVLQAADDGHEIALQLTAPSDIGFGSGIEGTPHQLQTHWMVNAIDNQFVVWGLVPSDIASVTISTRDGEPVSGDTVPVGSSEMESRAFAVILPQLAYIDGASGELADGSVSSAGVELEASLTQFQQHSPLLLEWTGFIPVVRH